MEARHYYDGLSSRPTLVYRTGESWSPPRGQRLEKELSLRAVLNHPMSEVWDAKLAQKVIDILDAYTIKMSTIEIVRFLTTEIDEESGEESCPKIGPVTVWIGVIPGSTSATAATALLRKF